MAKWGKEAAVSGRHEHEGYLKLDGDGVRDAGFEGLLAWESSVEYLPGTLTVWVCRAMERTSAAPGMEDTERAMRAPLVARRECDLASLVDLGPPRPVGAVQRVPRWYAELVDRERVLKSRAGRRRGERGVVGRPRGSRRELTPSELAVLAALYDSGSRADMMRRAGPATVAARDAALAAEGITLLEMMDSSVRHGGRTEKRRAVFLRILAEVENNKKQAAASVGMSHTTVRYLVRVGAAR